MKPLFASLSLFLSLALGAPWAFALWPEGAAPWIGGADGARPFLARGGRRWLGPTPGRVRAIQGRLWAGSEAGDAALVAFRRDGRPRRTVRFGGPLREEAAALFVAEGTIFVAGNAEGSPFGANLGGQDVFLLALESGTWKPRFALQWGSDNDDVLTALAPDGVGGVYLAGYEEVNEDCIRVAERGFVVRVGPGGRVRWAYRFGFEAASHPRALLGDETGVWVVGSSDGALFGPSAGGDDVFLLQLDANGKPVSATQWGWPGSDEPAALVRGPEGALWLFGTRVEGVAFRPFLARLDEAGRPGSVRALAGAGEDTRAVAARPAGGRLWLLVQTPAGPEALVLPWPLR